MTDPTSPRSGFYAERATTTLASEYARGFDLVRLFVESEHHNALAGDLDREAGAYANVLTFIEKKFNELVELDARLSHPRTRTP